MMLNSMALAPGQFPLQLTQLGAMVDAVYAFHLVILSPNEKPLGAAYRFCPYDHRLMVNAC